ncbi:MAG: cation:proton antiporter [Candidatus Eiseniibacteriota bacterium]
MLAHSDLTGLAVVAVAALLCGILMARLRQPAIVGYILAGVLLGPSMLGLVSNRDAVGVLAELGVVMLLFLIAMELSLRGFMQVWRVALLATLLQIVLSVGLMLLLSTLFGWTLGFAVLLGFVIAVSSTAVVIKMLEQINILRGDVGQLIVGILIAQDLAVVPMILTINAIATPYVDVLQIVQLVLAIVFLFLLIIYLSRRKRVALPFSNLVGTQVDLRPLGGLAFCFGAAALSGFAGLSPAFGAFLAGLVIGNSTMRATMIRSTRPIQSVLLMVFFLSIGLLIDLKFIWEYIGTVIVLLLIVTVLKTALNIGILHLLREPWPHAFIAGVMLAQIGEFSFILSGIGLDRGLLGPNDSRLIVAVTAFSLLFSPLWQVAARRLLRIILLSVTSFEGTFDLLIGDRLVAAKRRATTAARGLRDRARKTQPAEAAAPRLIDSEGAAPPASAANSGDSGHA